MTMERGSLLNKRYRIVEILGQGGMAAVYRAIDENLGVEVAVKENLFTTDEYARQFRLEATILASLRHPNLPRVSDHFVIEQQGQYLIMDFIEGEDLRQRLDRLGPLPEQEVIIIGVAISDAMMYMHSRKPMVLHRDIKPGNVRITPHGHIYLVDFGLAKIVQGREATSTGARAMTPGYSPPEQYGTARTDHRSDIYSLGATLYSALSDQLPEDGLARAMDQASLTPIRQYNPRVSKRLAGVIEKCLEIRPDNRYQNAEELQRDLLDSRSTTRRKVPIELLLAPPPTTLGRESSPLADDESDDDGALYKDDVSNAGHPLPVSVFFNDEVEDRPKSRPRKKKRTGLWILIALLFILSGITTAAILNPNLPQQALTWLGGSPTTTPTLTLPTNVVMSVIPSSTMTMQTATQAVVTLAPSPTPSRTATRTVRPTITKTPTTTPTLTGGGASQILFASDRSGSPQIYLLDINNTLVKQLTRIDEGACQPKWSPDGAQFVFISPCPRDQVIYPGASLFVMDVEGKNITPLPSVPGGDFDPAWSPNGQWIAFTSLRNAGVPRIFLISLEDYSVISLVDEDNKTNSQPAWSPDGKMLAYLGSDKRIWVMNIGGGDRRGLTIGGGDYENGEPAWSPDGSVVTFYRRKLNDTTGTNWLMAAPFGTSASMPVQVPNSDLVSTANFSPDGFWLVFKSWISGNHDIYVMRSNGVDKQVIVSDEAYDFDPAWRPYPGQP
jgi:serine/threonine protein kinase